MDFLIQYKIRHNSKKKFPCPNFEVINVTSKFQPSCVPKGRDKAFLQNSKLIKLKKVKKSLLSTQNYLVLALLKL